MESILLLDQHQNASEHVKHDEKQFMM
eukprot:SAG31_NODE_23459_length_504_cov_0.545679_2_plen_26_part_01